MAEKVKVLVPEEDVAKRIKEANRSAKIMPESRYI